MPKNKKIIAIAISDIHLANWKQFNPDEYRLKESYKVIEKVINRAYELSCPILNPGDLIDHPKHIDNVVMKYLADMTYLLTIKHIKWFGINGNHDLDKQNSFASPQKGYMSHLSLMVPDNFKCCDFRYKAVNASLIIHGIPYTNHNLGFIEALKERVEDIKLNPKAKHILMIHRDLAGAIEPDGKMVKKDKDGDEDIKSLFKNFDLVISGHIHKPQRIKALGKNVYMLGAPYQQRRSDKECDMGYWEIYEDMKMKFIPLETPKFRTHAWNELPENETDFWIKLPKPSDKEITLTSKKFDAKLDRTALVNSYMKAKSIKSKSKKKLLTQYLND